MTPQVSETAMPSLWEEVLRSHEAVSLVEHAFLTTDSGRIADLRRGLISPGLPRITALRLFRQLSLAERQELLPELVWLASCAHGSLQTVRQLLADYPRDWLRERLETLAEPLLQAASAESQFEEYRRFLELYRFLGEDELRICLAERARQHPDYDIREAGDDFIER